MQACLSFRKLNQKGVTGMAWQKEGASWWRCGLWHWQKFGLSPIGVNLPRISSHSSSSSINVSLPLVVRCVVSPLPLEELFSSLDRFLPPFFPGFPFLWRFFFAWIAATRRLMSFLLLIFEKISKNQQNRVRHRSRRISWLPLVQAQQRHPPNVLKFKISIVGILPSNYFWKKSLLNSLDEIFKFSNRI